jgi:DNA-binding transcriptional ArsR family regulator
VPDLVAAVAEPNRRRLLRLLGHGEQTVTSLASNFTVSRSAISQHLGVLAEAGLVVSRREGRFQYYRLNPEGMAALRAEFDSFWTRELDQLVRDALDTTTAPRPEKRAS